MKICKNKKTGHVFICLDEIDNAKVLMITPNGDVKMLERGLFTEPLEVDDGGMLLTQGQINSKQYNIYNQYRQK